MESIELHAAFRFVVSALAVWRVSFLLARESGPWELLAGFRRILGKSVLGGAFTCVKCLSVWVAIPFAFFVGGGRWEKLVIWLALSGMASLIDEWTRPPFEWRETSESEVLPPGTDRTSQ